MRNNNPFLISESNIEKDFYYQTSEDSLLTEIYSKEEYDSLKEKYKKKLKKGKFYLRVPSWSLMGEIHRECSVTDPFTKKQMVEPYKYRDVKIKRMLIRLEDEKGNFFEINDEVVDNMNPDLVLIINEEIDKYFKKYNDFDPGLSEDEARELTMQAYSYFKKRHQKAKGESVNVPSPPAILIIRQLCEQFHITPDEARSIRRKDLEAMSLVSEQEEIASRYEEMIGPKDKHVKFRERG